VAKQVLVIENNFSMFFNMTEYKFIHLKNNSDKLNNFIKKHGSEINKIIKSCFDVDYLDYHSWIAKYDIFCMMSMDKNDKVVAFASTRYKDVVVNNGKIKTYELITVDSDEHMSNTVLLGPFIESLCRDTNSKYKGVGTLLLKNITDYYLKENIKKVYLVPESNKYKMYGYNDCGVEIDKERYLESQRSLHEFYNGFGFHKLDDHYEFDVCDSYYPAFVFYPVFYKDLV